MFSVIQSVKKKFNVTTMIPLTNKEIKPIKQHRDLCCNCCTWYTAAICASLYNLISTMLLPLTVRGRIGGQYGGVMTVHSINERGELYSSTEMPFEFEMFVISLLFIGHLIGFYYVLKKSLKGMNCNIIFCIFEMMISVCWLLNVLKGTIKSHTMSQVSLGWYCSMSIVTQCASIVVLITFRQFMGEKVL